jgi:hypothetical protein
MVCFFASLVFPGVSNGIISKYKFFESFPVEKGSLSLSHTAEAGRRGAFSILKGRILFDADVRLSDPGVQHTLVKNQ